MQNLQHKTTVELDKEHELLIKAQSNPEYFEPIYNSYFERIFRFIYQRVDSKDEASDITSQVFLKALTNLRKYQFKDVPFSAWLYRVAINEISSYYAKSKKNRVVNIETVQLSELFNESNTDFKEEQIERITKALKYLSVDDLLLIEMRFFESRSFKEIGDILNITENNAKVKVYRVIDKLKQQLL